VETSKDAVERPAIHYSLVTVEGSVQSDARINSALGAEKGNPPQPKKKK